MNSQRHQQVKELFLAACLLEPGKVGEFLDRTCAGDDELRKEVESLLAHHVSTTIVGGSPSPAREGEIPGSAPRGAAGAADTGAPLGASHSRQTAERFTPGAILAGRYRVLAPLGRGGMGEVYRADDLKLDQPVALKFLPRKHADDAVWLDRFYNEVRLARKVTHPNVTRIYDIGDAGGETFISMEFVDGEDLASLLRRIGRLPSDKALQIVRQLCAGLGAAHDRGVLHRDLKPANIMIDGRGQVRITDFGIAALAAEDVPTAGTPAFMAPEVFAGAPATVRSDIYSLGIVLYELVTGKEPFAGLPAGRRGRDATPSSPSALVSDIDTSLERIILRCLERDPRRRPESAYAVAAAMPGADPLALALAAGETPSPNMVAAAGPQGALRGPVAITWLGAALAGLLTVVLLAGKTFFLPQAGLSKPPAVLADRAEQTIAALGHEPIKEGIIHGFRIDPGYMRHMMASQRRPQGWEHLPDARPPAVFFWYRQGDFRLTPPQLFARFESATVLPPEPGMTTVRLDAQGRLLEFTSTPQLTDFPKPASPGPDWSAPFGLAGLSLGGFRSIEPLRKPPMYADHIAAWEGAYPEDPSVPVCVEGASLGGRVVYFAVVPPWQQGPQTADVVGRLSLSSPHGFAARFALYLMALIGGSLLAWQNLQIGRGDQRGARRLGLFVLVLGLMDWLIGQRHVGVFAEEAASFHLSVACATLSAALAWICYLAAEPYVRRFWPQTMITWSRLLVGRLRDPLVGRDILVGGACGILLLLIGQMDSLSPSWLGLPRPVPMLPGSTCDLGEILGLRYKLSSLIDVLLSSISAGLIALLLMLLLRIAVGRPRLAAVAFWVILTAFCSATAGCDTFAPWISGGIFALVVAMLLVRVGLVAVITALCLWSLLAISPLTTDLTVWYAPTSTFAVLLAAGLLIYGFFTALGGQPLFHRPMLD